MNKPIHTARSEAGHGLRSKAFRALPVAVCIGSLLLTLRASGFDPDTPNYGHSMITASVAADGYKKWNANEEPFTAQVVYDAAIGPEKIAFSDQAAAQLLLGARSMDFLPVKVDGAGANGTYLIDDDLPGGLYISGEPFNPFAHCDDEQLIECSRSVFALTLGPNTNSPGYADNSSATLLEYAADLWLKPGVTAEEQQRALAYAAVARVRAGRALHTVQDLYAHSNWADLRIGSKDFLKAFGQGAESAGDTAADREVASYAAVGGVATCQSNPVPAETVKQISDYETSFCTPDQLCTTPYADYAADSDRKPPGGYIGVIWTTVVALGDYVKKNILNWANSGGNWDLVAGGRDTSRITTGYFDSGQHTFLGLGSATDRSPAKCDHGFSKRDVHLSGINKDVPSAPFNKDHPKGAEDLETVAPTAQHQTASLQAALASKQILQNIVDEVSKRAGSNTERKNTMIELFMGGQPAVAFVIDTTGSMQDIMDGIKTQVAKIVDKEKSVSGDPFYLPLRKFALTTYKEDNANKATVTRQTFVGGNPATTSRLGNKDQLLAAVNAMPDAFGGGDCPEPTMQALLETVRTMPQKSKVFVFTDASTKDRQITGGDGRTRLESEEIARLVKRKRLEVNFSLSGSCSPISPAYYKLAELGAGQVLLVDHTSADTAVALAGVPVGNESLGTVHLERGSLAAGASKTVVVPVESGLARLLLWVTNESAGIVLRDPNGVAQPLSGFLGGAMLEAANPAPGNWTLTLSGWPNAVGAVTSAYSVKVQAAGTLALGDVSYASKDPIPNLAHTVYFPYGERPPSVDVRVIANMRTGGANNPKTYAWQAVADDGTVLSTLDLSRTTPTTFEGSAAIASISAQATRPWRVRVSGTDTNDRPFARISTTVFNARQEVVSLAALPRFWVPGAKHTVKVHIDNLGAASVFAVSSAVATGSAQVSAVGPNATIGGSKSADIELTIAVPADAAPNSTGLVTALVTSSLAGGAAVHEIDIPVAVLLDTDGDGVPDNVEKGPNGLDEAFDGNGDGIADWKQASVVSLPSQRQRGYLTASLTSGQFRLARSVLPSESLQQTLGLDLIDFKVVGLASGAATQLKLALPKYMTASGYSKYGPLQLGAAADWYDFAYSEATQLGAKISANVVTLYLRDGAKGDDDLLANGEIVDAGGPTGVQVATASAATTVPPVVVTAPATGTSGSGGSAGGGGCTIGAPGQRDGSLVLLTALAAGVLWRRRSASRANAGGPSPGRRH